MGNLMDTLNGLQFGSLTMSDLISAIITALLCLVALRLLLKLSRRLLSGTKLDSRVQKYLLAGLKLLLYIITIVIVLEKLNIPSSSLVALLSVGSLGLTLAAEDILGNMAGGLVILSSRPFIIGDFIEAGGTTGTVEEISLNHTKLLTPDGLAISVPNKTLSGSQVTNYSTLGRRRVCRKVTASYDAPTETVKGACRRALEMTDGLMAGQESSVYLSDYGESSIEYTVFCWCEPANYWTVYYGLGEHLRTAFDEAGVEMTYDHLNVHIVENRT